MGAMALRNIPDDVHRRVKSVAESRGISVEEAARQLLDEATRPAESISQVIGAFI
jgi:plasmid stability protein